VANASVSTIIGDAHQSYRRTTTNGKDTLSHTNYPLESRNNTLLYKHLMSVYRYNYQFRFIKNTLHILLGHSCNPRYSGGGGRMIEI
jgi:hypothetical protein